MLALPIVTLRHTCTVLPLVGDNSSFVVQVTSLRLLDLSGNALHGTLPVAFASELPFLSVMFLGGNELTGTLPAAWGSMIRLAVADLGNNHLTGPLPSSWGALQHMRLLRLTSNNLSSPLPPSYGNWMYIQELQLGASCLASVYLAHFTTHASGQKHALMHMCSVCDSSVRGDQHQDAQNICH